MDDQRPNVVARVPGRGAAPPLLLHGHADVVPASGVWRHPPFSGELVDGHVWGRGTLDMKGGLAMILAAVLRASRAATPPPGDLIFAATSGEETGGAEGAAFLVREHAHLFAGVRHAVSEFGGLHHSPVRPPALSGAGRREGALSAAPDDARGGRPLGDAP
ncbi:MAG: M20/M25/M40 family metallo-hydrolase [Actinomycetota bacterium]|nr:M20/M25/M40 family metallo-hydrolase [Actinomycetota bacterium]